MKRRAVLYADDDIHWPLVLLWLCQITDVLGTVLFITAVWRGWGDPVPVPDTSEGGGTTCSPSVDLNFAPSTAGGKAGVIESLHLVCCLRFWSDVCENIQKKQTNKYWQKTNPEYCSVCIIDDLFLKLLLSAILVSILSNYTLTWISDNQ